MRQLRLLVFLAASCLLFFINLQLFRDRLYSATTYLILLDVIVSVVIILDLIAGLAISDEVSSLRREGERRQLALDDHRLESQLLTTVTEIVEKFSTGGRLQEMIDAVAGSVEQLFPGETIALQVLGEHFISVIRGGPGITLPAAFLEDGVLRNRPALVNSTESFPQYRAFAEQRVTSFIICPLLQRHGETSGFLGVFSLSGRRFTIRDMKLLRLVATPTSLLLQNAELLEKTKELSTIDGLTRIHNRGHFDELFSRALREARERGEDLSVGMCDIDFFKYYNDTNGHPAGDDVLRQLATVLKQGVKGSDIVARYGGEEFIVVLPGTSKENAFRVCDVLRRRIRFHRFAGEEEQPNGDLTVSFGVATFPYDGETVEELIKQADIALYRAKGAGKDRVVVA